MIWAKCLSAWGSTASFNLKVEKNLIDMYKKYKECFKLIWALNKSYSAVLRGGMALWIGNVADPFAS